MFHKIVGLTLSGLVCLALGVALLGDIGEASAQQKKPKFDPSRLKLIFHKVDPEIRTAQRALQVTHTDLVKARAAITRAMNDEVFGEKGATEGAVLDELKAALNATNRAISDVNVAIRRANLAQLRDKNP